MNDAKFYLDSSALRAWHTCYFQGWLRYLLGYTAKEERARLKAGSAYHLGMASLHRGLPPSECFKDVEWLYRQWAEANVLNPKDAYRWGNFSAVILHWLQTHTLDQLPYQVPEGYVEIPFEIPLDEQEGIYFTGRWDALGAMGQHYNIIEGKSTRNKLTEARGDEWMEQWHDDSQVSAYIWAGRQMFEGIGGVCIQAMQIKEIPSSTYRCKTHQMKYVECGKWHLESRFGGPFFRVQEDLDEWYQDALSTAREMRSLLTKAPSLDYSLDVTRDGKFHSACRWCEFKDPCRSGKYPDHFRRQLLLDPWDPRREEVLPPWRQAQAQPVLVMPHS